MHRSFSVKIEKLEFNVRLLSILAELFVLQFHFFVSRHSVLWYEAFRPREFSKNEEVGNQPNFEFEMISS